MDCLPSMHEAVINPQHCIKLDVVVHVIQASQHSRVGDRSIRSSRSSSLIQGQKQKTKNWSRLEKEQSRVSGPTPTLFGYKTLECHGWNFHEWIRKRDHRLQALQLSTEVAAEKQPLKDYKHLCPYMQGTTLAHGSASRTFWESRVMRTERRFSIEKVTSIKKERRQGAWPRELTKLAFMDRAHSLLLPRGDWSSTRLWCCHWFGSYAALSRKVCFSMAFTLSLDFSNKLMRQLYLFPDILFVCIYHSVRKGNGCEEKPKFHICVPSSFVLSPFLN